MPETFILPLTVLPADIDQMGHVNNTVYLRWVQDVATAHWQAIAPVDMQALWLWIVLRHEIDYLKSAMPGDSLQAHTWVGKADGARFDRFVDIRRGDVLLARARTVWCLIDAATMRPRRIPAEVVETFSRFSD